MIAILSPASLQCAGENVIGPFHGYCTNVFGVVQLFQSVHVSAREVRQRVARERVVALAGLTPANAAPHGQASTNAT